MIIGVTSVVIGASKGPQSIRFVKMDLFHVVIAHGCVEVVEKAGAGIWRKEISNDAKDLCNTLSYVVFVVAKPRTLLSISEQIPKRQCWRVDK